VSRYENGHPYQYAAANSARTRKEGCVWITGAAAVDAQSGGKRKPSPDDVLAKVKRSEETNPVTDGWSLQDLGLAMVRLDVPFVIRSGQGWAAVRATRRAGLYIALQGDSDRFPDGCSGAFDGDHCIGVHPDTDAQGRWRIDDPICRTATYQPESVLRAYAAKFEPSIRFGAFMQPVPIIPPDTSTEDPDVPGLSLAPVPPLAAGSASVPKGTEVIRVSDRKRIRTTADANGRPATGPYDVEDISGLQRGYLIDFTSGLAWVRESTLTFTASSLGEYNAGVDAAVAAAATARRD
jgi:hypothetical protein